MLPHVVQYGIGKAVHCYCVRVNEEEDVQEDDSVSSAFWVYGER